MHTALVKPRESGNDLVCGPIRGNTMVRRRNAENVTRLRIPAQAYRAMTVAEKTDHTADWVVFKAHVLKVPVKVRSLSGTDPGPAGFDWVEIDLGKLTELRAGGFPDD
jgi:hypothetical protein